MKMRCQFLLLILWLACPGFLAAAQPPTTATEEQPEIGYLEPITGKDRILVLAPHPDDETIGCAGIIQEALAKKADIHIIYLTNGDHNQFAFIVYEKRIVFRQNEFIHLGEVRRKEAISAMELLGLAEDDLVFLGYPDSGTFAMFKDYWQENEPFQSLLTRINKVPYKENFSYGLAYKPGNILADLEKLLLEYRPNKIFVSHPADVNLDHETFYLFLQIALSDLARDLPRPKIYPYLIHSVGWPLPRNFHPELPLLPPAKFIDTPVSWSLFGLDEQRLGKKYQAILCYKSQTESSAFYLLSFARKNELFGDYAPVELNFPPRAKPAEKKYCAVSCDKGKITYCLEEDDLLIRIHKPKDSKSQLHGLFYLFGYSYKTPFAQMPKITILTKYDNVKLFDAKKLIRPAGVKLELSAEELILRIPLKAIGSPDFILFNAKAYTGIRPYYVTGFRKIILRRETNARIQNH